MHDRWVRTSEGHQNVGSWQEQWRVYRKGGSVLHLVHPLQVGRASCRVQRIGVVVPAVIGKMCRHWTDWCKGNTMHLLQQQYNGKRHVFRCLTAALQVVESEFAKP